MTKAEGEEPVTAEDAVERWFRTRRTGEILIEAEKAGGRRLKAEHTGERQLTTDGRRCRRVVVPTHKGKLLRRV